MNLSHDARKSTFPSAVPFLRRHGERKKNVLVILFRDFIFLLIPARDTAMRKDILATARFYPNRFHKAAALCRAIAGININVLAPQT